MVHNGILGRDLDLSASIPLNCSSLDPMELKAENDNRSKRSNDTHWRSIEATFNEENVIVVEHSTVEGTVTLTKHANFSNALLLASAVAVAIPIGSGRIINKNPSAILAIKEWLASRIKAIQIPGSSCAIHPWVLPIVTLSSASPEIGLYVYDFRIELPTSWRPVLESEIMANGAGDFRLLARTLNRSTPVGDMFGVVVSIARQRLALNV
jgi:hypothetical protein